MLQIVEEIARDAGDVIMRFFEQPLNEVTKSSAFDVVTEADREAESLIIGALQQQFPDYHIVGEEGGGTGAPIEDAEYRWYVDPVDGTTNFANRIPMFCTSIALTDRDMIPLLGVVYNPVSGELFAAVQGEGATLNGKKLAVSGTTSLQESVVGSGFPYDKAIAPDNNLAEWGRLLTRTRGVRRMGSAALDLCYVAAGRFDGYWEQKLNPWDFLAAALCVIEAGGTVTNVAGETGTAVYQGRYMVASNGHIHADLLAALAS